MNTSFLSPAHVAGISSHTRAVIVKAFWNKSALVRGRVLQDITGSLKTNNPVRIQSVAVSRRGALGNWISAILPWQRNRRATIDRTQAHIDLVARRIISLGLILNLTGPLSRWSFRTLLQSFQESSCVQSILYRPCLSLLAVHDRTMQQKDELGHGKSIHSHG